MQVCLADELGELQSAGEVHDGSGFSNLLNKEKCTVVVHHCAAQLTGILPIVLPFSFILNFQTEPFSCVVGAGLFRVEKWH